MASKRKNLEIKRVGSLLVPFSQGRFAQLLLWLQGNERRTEDCPVDLTVLPDTPPSPNLLRDGDVFFVFREMQIEKDEDRNEIVFCYDRMRVESGGVEEPFTFSSSTTDNEDGLVRDVAAAIYEEHQIVFSIDLLKKLRHESPSLKGAKNVQDFVIHLKNRGLFKKASLSISPTVRINEEES